LSDACRSVRFEGSNLDWDVDYRNVGLYGYPPSLVSNLGEYFEKDNDLNFEIISTNYL
jgi:hypothetical protein